MMKNYLYLKNVIGKKRIPIMKKKVPVNLYSKSSFKNRKRPNWLKSTLQHAEGHATTKGTFREIKKPKRYSGYATYMTKLIEAEPSTFEEVVNHQEWKDAMKKNINQ